MDLQPLQNSAATVRKQNDSSLGLGRKFAMPSVILQGSSSVPGAGHTPSASNAKASCKPVEGALPMRGLEDWPRVTQCSTMATLHATNGC